MHKSTTKDYFSPFAVCERLPATWTNIATDPVFVPPVAQNTTLTVSCEEGYTNVGSDVVTCDTFRYDEFRYTQEPQCRRGKLCCLLQLLSKNCYMHDTLWWLRLGVLVLLGNITSVAR